MWRTDQVPQEKLLDQKNLYEYLTYAFRSSCVPHVHKDIETIAYLLEGECSVFHGANLENETLVKKGEQIFIPGNVPHL